MPEFQPLLRGIKPAVLAIILTEVWELGRKAADRFALAALGVTVAAAAAIFRSKIRSLWIVPSVGILGHLLHTLITSLFKRTTADGAGVFVRDYDMSLAAP